MQLPQRWRPGGVSTSLADDDGARNTLVTEMTSEPTTSTAHDGVGQAAKRARARTRRAHASPMVRSTLNLGRRIPASTSPRAIPLPPPDLHSRSCEWFYHPKVRESGRESGEGERERAKDARVHADASSARHADTDADSALGRTAWVPGAADTAPVACLSSGLDEARRRLFAQDNGELPAASDVVGILLGVEGSLGMYASGPSALLRPAARCRASRQRRQ